MSKLPSLNSLVFEAQPGLNQHELDLDFASMSQSMSW
jgi:hypothetical protein